MYKRRYVVKIFLKAVAILIAPPLVFLMVTARRFPPDGPWSWFFWITAEFAAWTAFLAVVAQLLGTTLRHWIGWDVFDLLEAFEKVTSRTLYGIQDSLPVLDRRLGRSETQEVQAYLDGDVPVLIDGESGSGKSGIAAAVVRQSIDLGVPTLFLDTRNYSSVVSGFGDLREYIGVERPLPDCLERTARSVGVCLLVVDQLDSAIGTPALQVSTELLAVAATLEGVRVVGVTCPFNAPEYGAIRKFRLVPSDLLDRSTVNLLLEDLGITSPSEAVRALSENLLCLSLVADLSTKVDVGQVEGEVALFEKYREAVEEREGAEFVKRVGELAYQNLPAGRTDFRLSEVPKGIIQRMQRHRLITHVGHSQYRFRHEQLLYYFYAHAALQKSLQPAEMVSRVAGRHLEGALIWMLRLLARRTLPELQGFLNTALGASAGLHFYEKAALLDEVQTWTDITSYPAAVGAVAESLSEDPSLARYFLRSKPPSVWAPILWERGFLDEPPSPEETETGLRFHPRWDAQEYLIEVAPEVPELVVEFSMSFEGAGWYLSQAVCALSRIPGEQAKTAVPRIREWLSDVQVAPVIAGEVCELTEQLIRDRFPDAGFSLLEALLEPTPSEDAKITAGITWRAEAKSRFRRDDYEVEEFIEENLPRLAGQYPKEVVSVLQQSFCTALRLEAECRDYASFEKESWWRSAIEDTDQDADIDYKDQLLRALRDSLEAWVADDPSGAAPLIAEYLREDRSVLRRLGLHILHTHPADFPDMVTEEVRTKENLDDVSVHHEFFLLLRRGYPVLNADDQKRLVSTISSGPPPERRLRYAEWAEEKELDVERFTRTQVNRWIYARLYMLRGYLSGKPAAKLTRLERELGRPEIPPEFTSWSSGVSWVRNVSPKPEQQLAQMSPSQMMDYLREWRPDSHDRFGSDRISYRGLANEVAKVVLAAPHRHTEHLPELALLRPEFPEAILSRARQEKPNGDKEWEFVIRVGEVLLEDERARTDISRSSEVGWIDARRSLVHLVQEGLKKPEHMIPPPLLLRVRDMLLVLLNDPDPDLETDRPPGDWFGHKDPATVAINAVRSSALLGVIEYAWLRAELERERSSELEEKGPGPSRLESSIRGFLTNKLDRHEDPSWAVHSVYGRYLPLLFWLDRGWVEAHIDQILPEGEAEDDIRWFVAAWDSFVIFNGFWRRLFQLLRPKYERAIRYLGQGRTTQTHLDPARHLANHVVWEYLQSESSPDSSAEASWLIFLFFDHAKPEDRADVPWILWKVLKANPDEFDQFWPKARAIWQRRTEQASAAGHPTDFDPEMQRFAHFLQILPEHETISSLWPILEAMLPHIARSTSRGFGWKMVEEYLATEVDRDPLRVIQFYRLMHDQGVRKPWHYHGEESRQIIAKAAATLECREEALSLIDLLARRGVYQFKDIYDQYSR